MQLFKELYDESTVKGVIEQRREQAMFSVQAVKAAFGAHYYEYGEGTEDELFSGFVAMLTHDALIGVQDRHHENWGVVVQREVGVRRPRFAPLYDSARGLFCNFVDGQLKRTFLCREAFERDHEECDELDRYVRRARPLVGFDGLRAPRHRHNIGHHDLIAAVFAEYPTQRSLIARVLDAYDWRRVEEDMRNELGPHWSTRRATLVLTCLRRRQRAIWRAIDGRMGGDN